MGFRNEFGTTNFIMLKSRWTILGLSLFVALMPVAYGAIGVGGDNTSEKDESSFNNNVQVEATKETQKTRFSNSVVRVELYKRAANINQDIITLRHYSKFSGAEDIRRKLEIDGLAEFFNLPPPVVTES